MKIVQIVGIERKTGVSKKTNKPYDFDVLYTIDVDPISPENDGVRCEPFIFSRFNGESNIADCVVGMRGYVTFGRGGYPYSFEEF